MHNAMTCALLLTDAKDRLDLAFSMMKEGCLKRKWGVGVRICAQKLKSDQKEKIVNGEWINAKDKK